MGSKQAARAREEMWCVRCPFPGGYFGGVGFLEKQASGERDITSGEERELEGEERKGMTIMDLWFCFIGI